VATRHVFRPTRPLFSANINVRSDEQVERERLSNQLSQLQIQNSQMNIEQLGKTMQEYDRLKEQESIYKINESSIVNDPNLSDSEKAQGISALRQHMKPEEYKQDVVSRIGLLNQSIPQRGELDDTSEEFYKNKGAELEEKYIRYGDIDALTSLKTNLQKRETKTGLNRVTGPEIDEKHNLMFSRFDSDLRKVKDLTEEEKAIVNSGQASHELFSIGKKYGVKNAAYLQSALTSRGDFTETRTDQYGNKLKQSVTDKNIQDLIIDYINTGFRSQESTDRWMQIIESDSGNETLRSNLQTRMADLKIAKRLPKTLSSWFSPTESTIEGVLEKDDKTGKYKQEKLLNDTKRESPELYDLLMAYEGLKSSRPSLYFQHYLDKVMLEERRNLLNNRNKPETPNFNAY